MINLFFPLFDLIDNWISAFLPFTFQNLLWGIIAGILTFIVYWLLSNQAHIAKLKNDMKIIRKQMFDDALDDKSEYNKLAKENLALSFKLLNKIFVPAVISILPVIIIALWYDLNYSYNYPSSDEEIILNTIPASASVNIEPDQISSIDNDGRLSVHLFNKTDQISIISDNKTIYQGYPFVKPVPYITKKKWWNLFISNPVGYLTTDSKIEAVLLGYPENVQFKQMPRIINGWELLFFIGIFISVIPLRIVFKVK